MSSVASSSRQAWSSLRSPPVVLQPITFDAPYDLPRPPLPSDASPSHSASTVLSSSYSLASTLSFLASPRVTSGACPSCSSFASPSFAAPPDLAPTFRPDFKGKGRAASRDPYATGKDGPNALPYDPAPHHTTALSEESEPDNARVRWGRLVALSSMIPAIIGLILVICLVGSGIITSAKLPDPAVQSGSSSVTSSASSGTPSVTS